MSLFDIRHIAFSCWGYNVSYVEMIGTLLGLVSIYFATRTNILTWPTGLINETFLFILFFQVQLYADMFLQVYFFIVTLYGWYCWRLNTSEAQITVLSMRTRIQLGFGILICTIAVGYCIKDIHLYLPQYFKLKAAFPFVDSFVMVSSILATVLLARMKIENWYLWLTVDIVSVVLFLKKEIYFLSLEYVIFLGLASYGLFQWKKQLSHGKCFCLW